MPMNNIKFGKLISTLRKEKNMTQKELAEKLNITDKAVSKWERGDSFPDITLIEPIAKELGITVGELINGEKNSSDDEIKKKINQYIQELKTNKRKKQNKIIKIIIIIILSIIASVSILCISKAKFATYNLSRAITGYIKIVYFKEHCFEVQSIPNTVMYARSDYSLNDYMKQFGYKEDTEKRMGYNRIFTNGEKSIRIKCWGLLEDYPFQIWEFGESNVIAKKDELEETQENTSANKFIELEEINMIANEAL